VERSAPAPVIEALQRAHRRGSRIVGLCMGSFPVAEAGLLDGRAGTTHWAWAETFARRFPAVRLDPKVLYIDHGDVVTSAGTAAGLDCCLHLLRQDVGAELANRVARRLVVPPHRQGSQAQFVEQPSLADTGVDRMARTLEWAQAHLDQDCGIDALARRAAMSRRSFTRHFHQATGMSVVQWLTAQRLALAQRLLETTDAPMERVAQKAGFGSPLSLRLAFARELDTTPSLYRREFSRRRRAA
jgi:transcriptional regulator GlxA family with amidase domain